MAYPPDRRAQPDRSRIPRRSLRSRRRLLRMLHRPRSSQRPRHDSLRRRPCGKSPFSAGGKIKGTSMDDVSRNPDHIAKLFHTESRLVCKPSQLPIQYVFRTREMIFRFSDSIYLRLMRTFRMHSPSTFSNFSINPQSGNSNTSPCPGIRFNLLKRTPPSVP